MAADIRRAAATDHIDDTLDYKSVSKRLLQFIGDSQFQLVETLTERIAQIVVREFGVTWVKCAPEQAGRDPRRARRRHPDREAARGFPRPRLSAH